MDEDSYYTDYFEDTNNIQNQSRVKIVSEVQKKSSRHQMWFWHPHPDTRTHRQLYPHYPFNLRGILYSQYNNTHLHWHQQETDNNNTATMATAVFVTKQQPTVNIIISITQIVINIVDDAVLLLLIVVLLLKGTIWLDMVAT